MSVCSIHSCCCLVTPKLVSSAAKTAPPSVGGDNDDDGNYDTIICTAARMSVLKQHEHCAVGGYKPNQTNNTDSVQITVQTGPLVRMTTIFVSLWSNHIDISQSLMLLYCRRK